MDLDNTVCEWETSNLEHRKFLESLDEDKVPLKSCHKDALVYRKSKFGTIKDDLVKKLFKVSSNHPSGNSKSKVALSLRADVNYRSLRNER